MITKLPIQLAAKAAEPGFSVLARNSAVNASRSIQEFCAATDLIKAKLCAGNISELEKLAVLTGSDASALQKNSPKQVDRKFTMLSGQRFLTRSIRKVDLSICPACWLEDIETDGFQTNHLALQRNWLPRPIKTCQLHRVALRPLPFGDYTTCYDQVARSQLEACWLKGIQGEITCQTPTKFERAALHQIEDDTPVCAWLPSADIDTLERWCLSLGLFIEGGNRRPDSLSADEERALVGVGFMVTASGLSSIHNEVDAALGRHSIRLGSSWLHDWALQSANPEERADFRKIMQDMCSDQDKFCLKTVSGTASKTRQVEAMIRETSGRVGRSRHWVRKALVQDGYLPAVGAPKQQHFEVHLRNCKSHIELLTDGLNAREAARFIGAGEKLFDGLVADGVIKPIRSRVFAKPRFNAKTLNAFKGDVDRSLAFQDQVGPEFVPIARAAFISSCRAGQILEFLISGQLPGSFSHDKAAGLNGIRISLQELRAALSRGQHQGYTMDDLRGLIALQHHEVRMLLSLGVLPSSLASINGSRRLASIVDPADFEDFLERFHTCRTAAKKLRVDEKVLRSKIRAKRTEPAPEGGGTRIYRLEDLRRL